MAKDTPSMAKNKIRRSLIAICDPHPSRKEVDALWAYFDSQCAYCRKPLDRASRVGHMDHLIPTTEGGSNSIFNHALSCGKCNGDDKSSVSCLLNDRAERAIEVVGSKCIGVTPITSRHG